MDNKVITIDLSTRSYDIYIGSDLLKRAQDFVPYDLKDRQVFIVYDRAVEDYVAMLETAFAGAKSVKKLGVKSGEKTKSFDEAEKVTGWMLENKISRNSLIFAVGGGVTGDLSGFCASIVLRGVPYIQIPTTLLAQVDSSVGGKTGINTKQGKNLIGSFYQPTAVLMDVETLKTLPKREVLAGYAEIVKYALINDSGFFNWLEQNGPDVCNLNHNELVYAIESSVRAKAAIVEADEKEERGQRALLNFGHTFGHALEAAAGYDSRLLHGEAVAIGMMMAFELSCRMGLCSREDVERVEKHFIQCGLRLYASSIMPPLKADVDELIELMRSDKKNKGGQMTFILVNGIGEAFVSENAPEKLVREVIQDSLGSVSKSDNIQSTASAEFKRKGVKGLWKSAFSSQS